MLLVVAMLAPITATVRADTSTTAEGHGEGSVPPAINVVTVSGCEPFAVEGSYSTMSSGATDHAVGRDPSMTQTWTLSAGRLSMSGYPRIEMQGHYTVLAIEDERVHVLLYDATLDGAPIGDRTVWFTFSACGSMLSFDDRTLVRHTGT